MRRPLLLSAISLSPRVLELELKRLRTAATRIDGIGASVPYYGGGVAAAM